MLLFLIFGMFSLIGCEKYNAHEELYTGVLKMVEYYPDGGFFGRAESWLVTFEDGTIFMLSCQPEKGFTIGGTYMIYSKPSAFAKQIKKLD